MKLLVVCVALLVALPLAGCLGSAKDPTPRATKRAGAVQKASVNETPLEARIGQRLTSPSEPSLGDWIVLEASAGPAGNLSGFRWVVPVGGIIGMQFFGQSGLVFEMTPIVPNNVTISDWCLFAFRQKESKAYLTGGGLYTSASPFERWGISCSMDEEQTLKDVTTTSATSTKVAANMTPRYMFISDTLVKELDNVFFVVAAKAPLDTPFGIGFRVLTEFPSGYTPGFSNNGRGPASSLDVFLARAAGLRARGLTPLGTGTGFQANLWSADYGVGAGGRTLATFERHAGTIKPPTPALDARPVANAWNFNVTSEFDGQGGWSFVFGSYTSYCGTGRWNAAADLHGRPFIARSLILQHVICSGVYPYIAEALVFGTNPEYMFYGGGNGGARTSLEILDVGAAYERMMLVHFSVGAPLEQLIRVTPADGRYMNGGVVGNVPP